MEHQRERGKSGRLVLNTLAGESRGLRWRPIGRCVKPIDYQSGYRQRGRVASGMLRGFDKSGFD